jgi:hypothetical protein
LGKHLNQHLCNYQKPKKDYAAMRADCEAFCSIGGKSVGFPLVLGTETYGFNLTAINDICLGGIFEDDPGLGKDCKDWSGALWSINQAAAKYLEAVEHFESQQIVLRADMRTRSKALNAHLQSDSFLEEVALTPDKLEPVKKAIAERILNPQSEGGKDITAAINKFKDAGDKMLTEMDIQLPQLQNFVEQCNRDFIGVGRESEYLLDICSQKNNLCVEEAAAQHVACCCGVNYVATLSNGQIDGISHKHLKGGRVLQEENSDVDTRGRALQAEDPEDARQLEDLMPGI